MHYSLFRAEENPVRKDDNSESSDDEHTKCNDVAPSDNHEKGKKNPGRKAKWSNTLLDDVVDIIVNSEYYKEKINFHGLEAEPKKCRYL